MLNPGQSKAIVSVICATIKFAATWVLHRILNEATHGTHNLVSFLVTLATTSSSRRCPVQTALGVVCNISGKYNKWTYATEQWNFMYKPSAKSLDRHFLQM